MIKIQSREKQLFFPMLAKRHNRIISLLVFSLFPLFSTAQSSLAKQFWFEHIQTEDGLSSSWVAAIVQDNQEYLWFGTQDGLVRYNGYEFITYRYDAEDPTSLEKNRVETLFVSSDGALWIGTTTGVNRYRPATDDFEHFIYDQNNPNGLAPGQINDFAEDAHGNIWWGTQAGGLVCFNLVTQETERFLMDKTAAEHVLHDEIRVLMFDDKGLLWIGTGEPTQSSAKSGGLLRFNPNTKEVRRFTHQKVNNSSLTDNRIGAILQDRSGQIWVGTANAGLHLYNANNESFTRFEAQPHDPHALHAPSAQFSSTWNLDELVKILHEDQKGRIWIGTVNGGLNVYNPQNRQLIHCKHEPHNLFSLTNNLVWSFFEDTQGRIWIGNFLAGLHKFDPAARKFQCLQHDPSNLNSLSDNDVVGLCASEKEPGLVWVATRFHGLNKVDISTGQIQRIQHEIGKSNSLGNNGLWTVYEDNAGIVWIGTSEGLDRYDPKTQEFEHFRHEPSNPNSLSGNSVVSIFEDDKNLIWIGTWGTGLNRLDYSKREIKRYNFFNPDKAVSNSVFVNSHFVIHQDRQKNLWVASWRGGLYRYLPEKDKFQKYAALNNIGGNCLYEDEDGNFWIGTNDRGLVLFNPVNGKILKNYQGSDGLPSNMILSILPSTEGGLWLSTDKGLSQFHKETGFHKNYDINDGLLSNTFNYQGGGKTPDGYNLFSSDKGLVFFNDHLEENKTPPTPYIIALRTIDRKSISKEQVYEINLSGHQEFLEFPFSQRDFSIDYLGLHYTNPSKNTYRYKLEPYDVDWVYNGTQRSVRYTNLDPGRYTFQLQAANNDGYWSTKTASLELLISPPWWQTSWAYFLYAIFTGLILYILYRILIERERQRSAIQLKEAEMTQLRAIDQMKSRFFANISHELRTPLTLIQGPIEDLVEGRIKDGIKAQYQMILRNTKRLQQLITQLLELARIDNGQEKLQPTNQDLIPFLRQIFSSFKTMSQNQGVEITFFSEWKSFPTTFDEDKLEKICVNLLSNALKFTPSGGSVLFFIGHPKDNEQHPAKDGVLLKISDTGVGIPTDQIPYVFDYFYQVDDSQTQKFEGSGIGLALVKQYVALYNGQISVNSTLNRGTTFSIFLPLQEKAAVQVPESIAEVRTPIDSLTNKTQLEYLIPSPQPSPSKKYNTRDKAAPGVLLVEDNEDIRMYIKRCLGDDYHVFEAINGAEGLALAIDQIPDLIISDVMMPVMDGFEFCQAIRTNQCTSHIPIILLTARVEVSDRLHGIEYGADAYLTKPFKREELDLRIAKLIEQRENLRQKFASQITLQPAGLNITSLDKQFLDKLIGFIESEISNEQISLADLSTAIGMSRTQIHRKLKALTGESPGEFIRRFRLQRAAQLLKTSQLNVSEIAFEVGFRSHSHFSQAFRRYYKVSPSDYIKQLNS